METLTPRRGKSNSTSSPFAALRRHSLQKKNKKIVDGKTIKDPAFKALFQDIMVLEIFLNDMNLQAVRLLETMGPFCLNSLKMSEMVCEFENCAEEYEKDARFYHAVVSSSMGSGSGDGFQNFVEELEDMVFTPINLQLNAINEMKLKLVERENIKTILDKKEKVLKKIRNMNREKVKNYNQKLKESEDEYNNLLQEYNSVHQYLFDTMNGLSTYKGSIVLNVLNGLKKAQLRFFSNATASLRVCVKNLTSKDDRTESISKSELSKELDDRASKSIIKVEDILKQVNLEEKQEKEKQRKSKRKERRKSKNNGKNKQSEQIREMKVDEIIIPVGIKQSSTNTANPLVHEESMPSNNEEINESDDKYNNNNNNERERITNVDKMNVQNEKNFEEMTPLRKRWLEKQKITAKNNNRSGDDDNNKEQEVNGNGDDDTFSDTDNDNKIHLESRSVTANDIKEILTTLKLKYDAGQITKVDKKKVKKLLKGGKFNEAIEYMGNAITQKLQDDEDKARQVRKNKDDFTFD